MSWGSFVKCVFPLRLHGSFLYLFKAQIGECSVIYCLFHADTQTLTRQFYTLHHWFTFLIVRVCHGLPDRSFNCVINQILLIFLITFSNTLHTQKGEKKTQNSTLSGIFHSICWDYWFICSTDSHMKGIEGDCRSCDSHSQEP